MRIKKIAINARFLNQSVSGVQRYAIELIKALDNLIDSGEIDKQKYNITLIAPRKIKYEINLKHIPLKKVGYLRGHLWEQIELPLYTLNSLLLNLCNTGPLTKRNQIVTIHDASTFIIPNSYSFLFRRWYQFILPIIGKLAKSIITVSNYSKEDLKHYCKIKKSKVHVIYHGREHIVSLNEEEPPIEIGFLKDKKYILSVGSPSYNKNFHSVIEALNHLEDQSVLYVIAGEVDSKVFAQSRSSTSERVKFLGYIDTLNLKKLYKDAICLVMPSFYESFGFPALEAMSIGCPVVGSETTALPEICGDAALYCDPNDAIDIADKLQRVLNHNMLRKDMIEKGKSRSELYSWTKSARDTFKVIKGVISNESCHSS